MSNVFKLQQLNFTITITVQHIGRDLLATIIGGDTPHIGTITTFSEGKKEVVRFPSHDGRFHKDDVLADVLLEKVSEAVPGNIVITSGVHVNHISKEQIAASFSMVQELSEEVSQSLKKISWGPEAIYS